MLTKYVKIIDENNKIREVAYKDIKDHEEFIIDDNVLFGLSHEYTDKEINDYMAQAYKELRELKKAIRENKDIVLKMDPKTERYKVYEKN